MLYGVAQTTMAKDYGKGKPVQPVARHSFRTGKNSSLSVSVWPEGGVTLQKRVADDKGENWETKGSVSLGYWEIPLALAALLKVWPNTHEPERKGE